MGLTKQYLRYASAGVLNFLLASPRSNIAVIQAPTEGKGRSARSYWICFACAERIFVWDLRKNEKALEFSSVAHEVTVLTFLANEKLLAAGYSDGSVAVYNLLTEQLLFTQKGHRSSVTCMAFLVDGSLLASASLDTEVALWDVVGQTVICNLKGHKSLITDCHFMVRHPYLVTSSKDALVKIWDYQTYRCCATLVGHRAEICRFVLLNDDKRIITGSNDAEIRIFDLEFKGEGNDGRFVETTEDIIASAIENENATSPVRWILRGSVIRQAKERITKMVADPTGSVVVFHGNDPWLEGVRLYSDPQVSETLEKRTKKKRKKLKKLANDESSVVNAEIQDEEPTPTEIFEAQVVKLPPVRCSGKIASVAFLKKPVGEAPAVLVNLADSLATYSMDISSNTFNQTSLVPLPAHRFDMRTCAVASDGEVIVTASSDSLRVWNREAEQCVHTLPCDYAVSSAVIPGDRYCVVGTKSGKLELFDFVEGSMHESVQAHASAVWAVCILHESKKGVISGSEDKEIKFWDLSFGENISERKMALVCRKSLQMEESVLSLRLSPDQRLLAIALTDSTVKIVFANTQKFFLSLYGHALPVLCLDISSDSQLIVTGSQDKSVKIWGLDFGDCHKSLFAHDEDVTSVVFIPRTHLFFSAGRDGKIKQWDADKFERITTLIGHHSAVWSLALTGNGNLLVSTSHDHSIRVWEKTQEILVLEEEREMEREKEQDEEDEKQETGEVAIPGESNKDIGIAGRKSLSALLAAEKLSEALTIVKEEAEKADAGIKDQPNAILVAFGNISPGKYVLEVLKKVKPGDLQGCLIALPLNDAVSLVQVLEKLLAENPQMELIMKCLTYLLRINALQVESNKLLLPELDELRSRGQEHIRNFRNLVGFNRSALEMLQQQIEAREEVRLFDDATKQFAEKRKNKKAEQFLQ
ncbi:WD repeat-containing protein 3-like [Paramacrobiotus metropolitanus]|uniref:WD repeat-containing protein 3-like n=1 Tax=Paramacrobiotus metropolitanus TaxID=2943436 RepID=UPI002445CD1B|nr:WD repeat-containing protein 3-like [Paramacrobiotus metropolitanus]